MSYTCAICGTRSTSLWDLCDPLVNPTEASFCDFPEADAAQIADEDISTMEYSCNKCGRLAAGAGELCEPVPIGEAS